MPGSASYASIVRAGQRVAIVNVVVNLRYTVVLPIHANQTEQHAVWVRSVVCWEERFASTGSVIRGLQRTVRVEARDVRAKR